jgi:hypothetical protein
VVRNDLANDPQECPRKLGRHTAKISAYEGWVHVLEANPDTRLYLDRCDWLFFFGKPHGTPA